MKIACLQFDPKLCKSGDGKDGLSEREHNFTRADVVLQKAELENLDLLVLPEMAFTGFNFKNFEDICPVLEHQGMSATSRWAAVAARKYKCVVSVGYPEIESPIRASSQGSSTWTHYNSTALVNEHGKIGNYRKSFLYTDDAWAQAGKDGFGSLRNEKTGLGNIAIGMSTDLNPRPGASWTKFEFASHILDNGCSLAIVTMAWETLDKSSLYSQQPEQPDDEALLYWISRLQPLRDLRRKAQGEVIVVFCNRVGSEEGITYCGTSAVVGIDGDEVKVYGVLGRGEKKLLIIDTDEPPFGKIVDVDNHYEVQESPASDSTTPQKLKASHAAKIDSPASVRRILSPSSDDSPASIPTPLTSKNLDQLAKFSEATRKRSKSYRDRSWDTSCCGTGNECEIPTPEGPSPTPLPLRPKISVPEPFEGPLSPRTAALQEPEPLSAMSFHSMSSVNSYHSFTSARSQQTQTSTNTVRSFTRAPEDSTPYPRNDMPRRGAFQFPPPTRKSYRPDFALNDAEVAETPIDTPLESGYWSPAMGHGSKPFMFPPVSTDLRDRATPQPFQWDQLPRKNPEQDDDVESRPRGRDRTPRDYAPETYPVIPGAVLGMSRERSRRLESYHRSRDRHGSRTQSQANRSKSRAPSQTHSKASSRAQSRAQSRVQSRTHSRAHSRSQDQDQVEEIPAIDPFVLFAQRTAHLAPGADAAQRIRELKDLDSAAPPRPSSPKSRNASFSRSRAGSVARSTSGSVSRASPDLHRKPHIVRPKTTDVHRHTPDLRLDTNIARPKTSDMFRKVRHRHHRGTPDPHKEVRDLSEKRSKSVHWSDRKASSEKGSTRSHRTTKDDSGEKDFKLSHRPHRLDSEAIRVFASPESGSREATDRGRSVDRPTLAKSTMNSQSKDGSAQPQIVRSHSLTKKTAGTGGPPREVPEQPEARPRASSLKSFKAESTGSGRAMTSMSGKGRWSRSRVEPSLGKSIKEQLAVELSPVSMEEWFASLKIGNRATRHQG